jgi:thiamine pyrophosphate-dependent acetolactate synthase large subunit-like protein
LTSLLFFFCISITTTDSLSKDTLKIHTERRLILKGVDAAARILQMEGTRQVFTFPDDPLATPCGNIGIKPYLAKTERGAIAMADAFTRMKNGKEIGVCSVMGGGGIENSFEGIAQAWEDLVPILLMPGGPSTRTNGLRGNRIDVAKCYDGVTKWVSTVNYADRVPEFMRIAFTYLRSGRPSPVILELPGDVANGELDDAKFNYKPVRGWKPSGDTRDVEVATKALLGAKNPVIYVGQGVFWADACEELQEFVELVQAPVTTTLVGKSTFPENHPLSIGFIRGDPVVHFLEKADLVFSIGSGLNQNTTMAPTIPQGKTIVQCTIDERDLNKGTPVDFAIMGDAKLVLRQLIAEVKKQRGTRKSNPALLKEIEDEKKKWIKQLMPFATSNEVPINPYRVIWDLMNTVDRKNTILTHDAGSPRDQTTTLYESVAPHGFLGWGHVTSLGFSIPAIMGAKVAEPDKFCVAILGDASAPQASLYEFETALRHKIPVLGIVLNNSQYAGYESSYPYTMHVTPSSVMSHAKVVEALGAWSERVEKPDEIVPAIKRAEKQMRSGCPALLEVITCPMPKYGNWGKRGLDYG